MVSIDANPKLGYIDMNGFFVDGVDVDPKKYGASGSGSVGTYGASAWFALFTQLYPPRRNIQVGPGSPEI